MQVDFKLVYKVIYDALHISFFSIHNTCLMDKLTLTRFWIVEADALKSKPNYRILRNQFYNLNLELPHFKLDCKDLFALLHFLELHLSFELPVSKSL